MFPAGTERRCAPHTVVSPGPGQQRTEWRCAREKFEIGRARPTYLVTTTVVPTLTRPNRSVMSWLYMRMQP